MFSPVTRLLSYLRPPPGVPWRWSDDGSVIVWSDDTVIVFREELRLILSHLVLQGWPPCSALVLLIASTKGKVPTLHEALTTLGNELKSDLTSAVKDAPPEAVHLKQALNNKVQQTLKLLEALAKLPPELLKSPRHKAVLVEIVFEHQEPDIKAEDTQSLLDVFDATPQAFSQLPSDTVYIRKEPVLHDIHVLREGLQNITPESLTLRIQTGLDELPGEVDVQLPPARRMAQLMNELEQEPEHSGLVHLIREVAASLYLPRSLDEHDEMALGGVSDITNRGTLDRLLLSELAHDDLTLSVRVALNEALYLRREPPSRQPPGRLLVLLDSGVRMWGIPRVIGTAAAMAFTLRRDQHSEIACWRAHNENLIETDLLNRNGLTEHFKNLEPQAHLGAALPKFLEECELKEHSEAVIITHLDALQDEDFLAALSRFSMPCWVAGVERDGRFVVYQHPDGWTHPLCSAEVDLSCVLNAPFIPDAPRQSPDGLPLFLSQHPSPLLSSITGEVNFWLEGQLERNICIAGRRLYRWQKTNQGAELLSASIPPGRTLWAHETLSRSVYILKGHWANGSIPLTYIPGDGSPQQTIQLRVNCPPNEVCHLNGKLLLLYRPHVDVFDPETGEHVSTMKFGATMSWVSGRYCRTGDGWVYLDWDGNKLVVHPLQIPADLRKENVLVMFDRADSDLGPWMLTHNGTIHYTAGSGGRHMMFQITGVKSNHVQVSRDGNRMLIGHQGNQIFVDLKDRRSYPVSGNQQHRLEPLPALPTVNVRNRVNAIQTNAEGRIMLQTRRGHWLQTDISPHKIIRLAHLKSGPELRHEFKETDSGSEDYSLQVAELANGCKAWLDSRGFLHLTCAHTNQPQLCLVLNDDHVTVWCSDGAVSGTPFFLGTTRSSPAEHMYQRIVNWAKQAAC